MLLRRLLPFVFLFSGLFVCGNNLNLGSSVKIIDVTSSEVTFEISVSWSNSWSDGFNNDAAWIFFKYRTVSGNWSHLFLNGRTEVSEGYSFLPGSSGGDLTGLLLFRSSAGSGNASSVCRLNWDYSGTGLTSDDFHQNKVLFMAQGIEMVFVPFGSFVLGDGVSSSSFVSASGAPVSVTGDGSEEPVELHTLGSSSSVSLSGTYPSGFNGFYIMKYELSQEQYVAFINSLSRSEQLQLLPQLSSLTKGQYIFGSPDAPSFRNGIIVSVPLSESRSAVLDNNLTNDDKYGNSDDGRTLACNYMSISDLLSYTAWSGLRPLAESEYEKTCRRLLPQLPTVQEYAWGTTSLTLMSAVVSETAGWNNETPNNGNANAEGAFGTFPGSGPVRCGAFSAVATNRSEAGSTFCGVMEMSGNLSELCVNASRYPVAYFDGSVHGSGTFSLNDWGTGASSSFGLRGGGFSSEKEELRVSDRSQADNNHFTSLTVRDSSVGFRGVRMLNPADIAFNAGNISLSKDGDVICSGEPFTLLGSPAFASGISGLSMHYSWYMDGELLPDENGRDLSFPIGIFNKNNTDKTFTFRREVNCALGTFFASFTLTVPGRLQLSLPEGNGELQLSCNISSVVTASRNKASSFRWFNGTSGVALTDWSAPSTFSHYTPSHTHFGYVGAQRKLRCVSDMNDCKDSVEINLFILPSCSLILDKTAISMSSNTNGETVTASLCGAGEVSWYYLDDSGRENVISSAMTSGTPNGASPASSYTATYTPKYSDFKNTIGSRTVVVRSKLGDNSACQDRQELTVNVSATLNPGVIIAPSPSVACGNTDVLITSSQNAGVDGMSGLTPAYQWFVDGSSTPLANETASTLKYRLPVNTTNNPVSHTFVRKAFTSSPVLQSGNSNSVSVTVPGVPSVTIGTPVAVCDGQSLALPSTGINWAGLSGNGKWTLNGVAVPDPVRYANNGQTLIYTLSNSCHTSVKSNGINITVNNRPTVKTLSAPVAVCAGNALPYPVAPVVEWNGLNGSVAWKLNNNVVPNPVLYSHNGQLLTYEATNGCGTSPSNGVPITVNDKPLIGSLSSPVAVCAGTSLILPSAPSVTWRSEAGSVAWKLNNVAVPNPVQIGHNGLPLTYEATSSCGTTTSNGVPISVKPVTVITTHPVSQPVCSGQTATLSVVAGGTGPFSYQWKNGSTAISGATSASYTASSAGSYSCVVTGGCGSATSNTATVSVNNNPTISTTPNSVCGSGTVTLSAVPSSGAVVEWYSAASGGNVLASGNAYTTPTISTTTTYYAGAKVASTGCVSTSRTAVVATVNAQPAVTGTTPNSRCGGGTVVLSATASSGAVVEWFAAASGGNALFTGNTYTTPTISTTTTYYAGAKIASTGCVSTSRTAVVATVNVQPTVTGTTPNSRCGGGTVALSAVPSSGASIEWFAAASGGNVLASGNTYTTPTISTTTTYYAGAKIASTGCVSTSRTAVVATVNVQPTVTGTTPNSRCGGGTVVLSAVPSSGAAIEWFAAASGGNPLFTGNTYTTPTISTTTTYYVGAKIASTGCVSTSRTAVVAAVNAQPTVTGTTPNSVCGSGTVTLSAVPSSGAVVEWYTASSGGSLLFTGTSYTTPTISTTTTYYAGAKIASTGCVSTSRTAVVATVRPLPVGNISGGGTVCPGGSANISLSFSGGTAPYRYTVTGAGEANTSNSSVTLSKPAGTYYLTALRDANGCAATSRTGSATVNTLTPAITNVGTVSSGVNGNALCYGGNFTVSHSGNAATNCGTINSYTWTRTGTSSATSIGQSWSQNGLAAGSYTYSCTVGSSSGASASAGSFTVVVRPLPSGSVSGGGSVCPGGSANISLSFSGGATPYYYTVTGTGEARSDAGSFTLSKPAGTYHLTGLRDAYCTATSRTGSATVGTIAISYSPGSIYASPADPCTNAGFTLTTGGDASANCGVGVSSYTWIRSDGATVGSGASLYLDSYGDGTYYFRRQANFTNGGTSATGNISVTVKSCGPPTIVIGGKTWTSIDICTSCTWQQAIDACRNIGMRLPDDKDWSRLMQNNMGCPPNVDYWSATVEGSYHAYTWYWDGSSWDSSKLNRSNPYRVRCVKD